jgi:hypothetical protein
MGFIQATYNILSTLRAESAPNEPNNILIAIAGVLGSFLAAFAGKWLKDHEADRQNKKIAKDEAKKETNKLISPLNLRIKELEETNDSFHSMLDKSQALQRQQEAFYENELVKRDNRLGKLEKECMAERVFNSEKIALLEDKLSHETTLRMRTESDLEQVKAQQGAILAINEEYRGEIEKLRRRKGTGDLSNPVIEGKEPTNV